MVYFYYEDGELIFSVEDTMRNNLFDAIERLYMSFRCEGNKLDPMVERMTEDDCKKM